MTETVEDTGYAPDSWEFDGEVTRVFDDMLERSIPQYRVMRRLCFDVASRFQQHHTDIVDLGCSRGGAMVDLIDRFGAHNRFVGLECSKPMLEAARQRFSKLIECGVVHIVEKDLRYDEYPAVQASVTQSVFTLQFVPIEYRQKVVREAFLHTVPGGAMILAEKILGDTAELDELLVERYLRMKKEHGYTEDEIQRKRLSLEGRLVPVTARWNEELLRRAGFRQIDCFWRWVNFAAWVAVKE